MHKLVVAINVSIQVGGNADFLMDKFIDGLKTVDDSIRYFKLRDQKIANCKGCCECKKGLHCSHNDDMTTIREFMEKSEILVLALPIYWCEITGLMKTFMDRLYYYHHSNHSGLIAGKKAIIITPMREAENIEYTHYGSVCNIQVLPMASVCKITF